MYDVYIFTLFRTKARAKTNSRNVDVFSFIDKNAFEKVHLSFCKHILGVRRCSPNLASRLELGRFPIENFIRTQSILYFARLHIDNINPILKESFSLSKLLHDKNIYSWYSYIIDILPQEGIELKQISSCKNSKDVRSLKPIIKNSFHIYYNKLHEEKLENLNETNKLYLYKKLKMDLNKEFYLSFSNFNYRKLISN